MLETEAESLPIEPIEIFVVSTPAPASPADTIETFSLYCLTNVPASCVAALVPSTPLVIPKKRSDSLES